MSRPAGRRYLRADERALLARWNSTEAHFPRDASVHEVFEEQVRCAPDATALVWEGGEVSYAALDAQAQRISAHLGSLGVGTDEVVGVGAEPSPQLFAALIGILKAGAAYLPLDPAYPAERLAFMLSDVEAQVVLADSASRSMLPRANAEIAPLELLLRDDTSHAVPPAGRCSASNLAYVMYTSGSTGRPKGVAVTHRNVLRLVKGANYARFDPEDVFLQFAPVSFDASTFEIWGALLNGARLAIPAAPRGPDELARAISRFGVTTLWLTAPLFHEVVDDAPWALDPVRQILTGGDVVSVERVRKLFARRHPTISDELLVVNGYGPTESTTFATCFSVRAVPDDLTTFPIGCPIANTTVHVLDDQMEPVPIGEPGELYIGGEGVARGYFRRPALTAERFVPDPFSPAPGARLYRTGDRVRYRSDGTLDFLGRIDRQAKIRGFRVEPAEIEAALRDYSGVRGVAVMTVQRANSLRTLVAFVVPEGAHPSEANLRAFLKDRVPEYMIPSAFHFVERLPLTAVGKIDTKALERLADEEISVADSTKAYLNPTESELANIWCEVLERGQIERDADFFDIGGHSLLAMRIVARISAQLGIDIQVKLLFEAPTIASLAAHLDGVTGPHQAVAATTKIKRYPRQSFSEELAREPNATV